MVSFFFFCRLKVEERLSYFLQNSSSPGSPKLARKANSKPSSNEVENLVLANMHSSLLSWRGNLWLAGADVQTSFAGLLPRKPSYGQKHLMSCLASKCKLTSWIGSISGIRRVWFGYCLPGKTAAQGSWLYNPCSMGLFFLLYFPVINQGNACFHSRWGVGK